MVNQTSRGRYIDEVRGEEINWLAESMRELQLHLANDVFFLFNSVVTDHNVRLLGQHHSLRHHVNSTHNDSCEEWK